MDTADRVYPARLDGHLDPGLSRWLWLVKWILVIPHLVVLAVLWIVVLPLTVVAGVTVLVSGRYPRGIFDVVVGVVRWSWRVSFYAFSAVGTDRYPPFTLAERPDYPATFGVTYPEQLSRGLVLVKWWLLAFPQYLVVAVFTGAWVLGGNSDARTGGGLVALLTVIAGVVLLVRGRYPRDLFSFLMGLNRWCYRVLAYALLLTDDYPPFRLDTGGTDPGTVLVPPPLPRGRGAGGGGGGLGSSVRGRPVVRALVVHESMFGNTRRVAEAVAAGLRGAGEVTVVPVGQLAPEQLAGVDLLVVGGPTHVRGTSRPRTREGAAEQAAKPGSGTHLEPGATGPGLREWLASRPELPARAAAFDTRVPMSTLLTGRAAPRIARSLQRSGCRLVGEAESFLVTTGTPALVAGELDRARAWGASLAGTVLLEHPSSRRP